MENSTLNFKNIPHAMIIRQAPLSDFDAFLKQILKELICPEHGCNKCKWCEKIDKNAYCDLVVLNALEGIKKEDIIEITNRFSRPGLEDAGIKVYVIKNIEYGTKHIFNPLLKFVEEPPENVYAIFTTRNYGAIIPTLKSRCHNFFLANDDKRADEFLKSKQIKPNVKELIKACFFTFKEMEEKIDKFFKYYEMIREMNSSSHLVKAYEHLNTFKTITYEDIKLFLEICKNMFPNKALQFIQIQDNLHLNINKTLIFNEISELLKGKK